MKDGGREVTDTEILNVDRKTLIHIQKKKKKHFNLIANTSMDRRRIASKILAAGHSKARLRRGGGCSLGIKASCLLICHYCQSNRWQGNLVLICTFALLVRLHIFSYVYWVIHISSVNCPYICFAHMSTGCFVFFIDL